MSGRNGCTTVDASAAVVVSAAAVAAANTFAADRVQTMMLLSSLMQ